MRFHQAVTFLPTRDIADLAVAADEQGYAGLYLSDHLFNPRQLRSRYTYSKREDGAPFWAKETEWPDPMCLVSNLAAVTTSLEFTTGVYVAPVRDLVTVAKTVGTAAVLSDDRVRLGVGVGWCEEEFVATGQDFHTRGRRLDEMIHALRALWEPAGDGWVEFHGAYYEIPPCQMRPAPSRRVPIYGGGDSEPALRRAATLCDGWLTPGAVPPEAAWAQLETVRRHLDLAGRSSDDFAIYIALEAMPDLDLYRRFADAGVTDMLCAPWMGVRHDSDESPATRRDKRRAASARFAEQIVHKL